MIFGAFTVKITFLFVVTVAFCLISDPTGIAALALLACFLHECGHLAAFLLTGYIPRALIFELTGIRLVPPGDCPRFFCALFIHSAGILTNGIMAAGLYWLGYETAAAVHFLLGCFSALPLATLDGGQIVLLILTRLFPMRGALAAWGIDLACTGVLCAGCIWMFLIDRGNLTLLIFSGGLISALVGGMLGGRKKPPGKQAGRRNKWSAVNQRRQIVKQTEQ